jgi:lipopolysaccharide cholinephosphotransferase
MMPVEIYRRMLRLINDEGLRMPEPYRVSAATIAYPPSPHHIHFPKVYDMRTRWVPPAYVREGIAKEMGIWVDIFPLLGKVPATHEQTAALFDEYRLNLDHCLYKMPKRKNVFKMAHQALSQRSAVKKGYEYWAARYDELTLAQPDIFDCEFCFDPTIPAHTYRSAWFESAVPLEFEGVELPAPKDYEQVLEAYYGDWRKLPPEEEQVKTHHADFVWA